MECSGKNDLLHFTDLGNDPKGTLRSMSCESGGVAGGGGGLTVTVAN